MVHLVLPHYLIYSDVTKIKLTTQQFQLESSGFLIR